MATNRPPPICTDCTYRSSDKEAIRGRVIEHSCMKYASFCEIAIQECPYQEMLQTVNQRVEICDYHNDRFIDRFKALDRYRVEIPFRFTTYMGGY